MVDEGMISVIIPAFNEEKYIEKTVDAVLSQNYKKFEVIVVPNGCSDATEKVLNKYMSDNRVKMFSQKEAKVSKARNKGAQFAKGEILIFLDADVIVSDGFLKSVQEHFGEEHAVASTIFAPDLKKMRYLVYAFGKNVVHKSKIYHGSAGSIICRKKDFDVLNGFNENLVIKEDSDLINRLRTYGRYTCIPHKVEVSMRRLEKWGLLQSGYFFTKEWAKKKLGFKLSEDYEGTR